MDGQNIFLGVCFTSLIMCYIREAKETSVENVGQSRRGAFLTRQTSRLSMLLPGLENASSSRQLMRAAY